MDPATSSSSSSSGSDSDDDAHAAQAPRVTVRRGRKLKREVQTQANIEWLSNLLTDIDVATDLGGVESSEKLAAAAAGLVEEAFGMKNQTNSSIPSDVQDVEVGEESFAEEVTRESGMDLAQERENMMIQQACGHLMAKDSKDIRKSESSAVVEENIAVAIEEYIATNGCSPEEAAEEVMLNQSSLLGNEDIPACQFAPPDDFSLSQPPSNQPPSNHPSAARDIQFHLHRAFDLWFEECVESLEALQHRMEAIQSKSVAENGELSLVHGNIHGQTSHGAIAEDISVFWVHWHGNGGTYGRPATLDSENRVKCIVATGALREPRNFSSVSIIHPAIGVKMERVRGFRGTLRPQVPSRVLRLRDIWQTALIARDHVENSTMFCGGDPNEKCFICNKTAVDTSSSDMQNSDVFMKCPLCLLSSHSKCGFLLLEYSKEREGFSFPDSLDLAAIDPPDVLSSEDMSLKRILGCTQENNNGVMGDLFQETNNIGPVLHCCCVQEFVIALLIFVVRRHGKDSTHSLNTFDLHCKLLEPL